MVVNFLIVGTQKGGTTALARFIAQHPKVFIPSQKELHYFDNKDFFKKYPPNYTIYHDWFQPNENQILLGEATPIYMYWKKAAKRIFLYNPCMKLIFILRNPIDRAYSHYNMEINCNNEYLSFRLALFFELVLRWLFPLKQFRVHSYIDRGYYSKSIKRMMKFFPKEQMLFLRTEDLQANHQSTLKKVFEFLNIPNVEIEQENFFVNEYHSMNESERNLLKIKYHKEIEKLEVMLSWNLNKWKS
ncbi:MAG: sulfotransferase [Bacteroidota bacterium]